jgi:hypothetical protein
MVVLAMGMGEYQVGMWPVGVGMMDWGCSRVELMLGQRVAPSSAHHVMCATVILAPP